MSDPSKPLERFAEVTPSRAHELPEQELENQYPTKPFGPLTSAEEGAEPTATTGLSPMDLARQTGAPGSHAPPSPEQIQTQSNQVLKNSESMRDDLERRFGDLSDGQKALLLAKLSKYNGSAEKAASLVGASGLSPKEKEKLLETLKEAGHPSGMVQFLSMITSGDTSLRAVTRRMAETPSDQLSPVEMLKAQYALQAASKSVNFATAVVGQGLNFVKTVMQTQI